MSTAIDTIRLGHRAVAELDDSSYARTLFEYAKVQLESNHYDVSQWLFVIGHAAADLCDHDLIRKLVTAESSSCTHFSSAYQLARSVLQTLEPPDNAELARLGINEWKPKMSDPSDQVRLLRSVLELFSDRDWVIQALSDCKIAQFDFLLLAEFGHIADEVNDRERSKSL